MRVAPYKPIRRERGGGEEIKELLKRIKPKIRVMRRVRMKIEKASDLNRCS